MALKRFYPARSSAAFAGMLSLGWISDSLNHTHTPIRFDTVQMIVLAFALWLRKTSYVKLFTKIHFFAVMLSI
jgi:sugar phosphate permease